MVRGCEEGIEEEEGGMGNEYFINMGKIKML